MADHNFCDELRSTKEFFDRSTRCFDESNSAFTPIPEGYTVAQHVAHTAQTVDWFLEGAFSPKGMDTDFEKHVADARKVTSLKAARAWLDRSFAAAISKLDQTPMSDLMKPIAPGIMGGAPRMAIVGGIVDHTAHHRGALTVYARLAGRTPAMPYMEV